MLARLIFLGRVFPLGIDFGFELAAANQFLKVADNGAAGDTKLAGEGGDVGPLAGFADDFADVVLAAEAVGRAAEQVEGVDAVGAFEGLELADGFMLAAFFEGGLDGAFEGADVHRLGEAVMGAAGSLERLHLLVHFQGARDDDDGHKRQQLLELGQEIQAELALRQDVVKDQHVGRVGGDLGQGLGAVGDADQFVFGEGLLVDLILEVVVFDDEDGGGVHGSRTSDGTGACGLPPGSVSNRVVLMVCFRRVGGLRAPAG